MTVGLTSESLSHGLARICTRLEACADELNTADGKLGDGDLGVTMQRGARGVQAALDTLPADVGQALMVCAQAFVKISGSTYGTLLATGLMSAAKACKGREAVPWAEMSSLVAGALTAMQMRGKGALGDKTVLDALDAVRDATAGLDTPAQILAAATAAIDQVMNVFRDKPSRQGRARMFGDKSLGLDDPGMLALRRMLESLEGAL